MTIEGMGNESGRGGQPGDLTAIFEEVSHDIFTRHGDNIVCDFPVSFTVAALGGTVTVPTISGETELKIPSGTQPGKVLKLRNQGIPHLHHGGKGDQLVRIVVWVPTKLSSEDKKLLESLDRSESFKPPEANKSFFSKLRETLGV